MAKEIEITIGPDGGDITLDKIGFNGSSCSGAVDDIIKMLGCETSSQKKSEYYRNENVHVNEFQ